MYLILAIFWLVVGVLFQIFWTTLQPMANIPVDRTAMGVICFIMFSYSFVRWRMMQMMQRSFEEASKPQPRPRRVDQPIDPTFDFSDPKPPDGGAAKRPNAD